MKKILLLFSACLLSSGLYAQHLKFKNLSMETGYNFTTFDYTDSEGNHPLLTDLTNTPQSRTALAVGVFVPNVEGLSASLGASLDKINVKSRFLSSANDYQYVDYNFSFAAANLGLHYDLFNLGMMGESMESWVVQLHAGASANRIIDGYLDDQTGSLIDLKESDGFENYFIDYNYGAGIRYDLPASPISLQANYRWKNGLEMEETTDEGGKENYSFDSHVFSFGVVVDLASLKKTAKANSRHSHQEYVKKSEYSQLQKRLVALEQAPAKTTTVQQPAAVAHSDAFNSFKLRIFFPFNKKEYYSSFQQDLDYALQLLRDHPGHRLTLVGFADRHGAEEYNMNMSRDRAQVISDFFTQNGIAKERIAIDFKGAEDEIDPTYHILNRRVELFIEK